jgi:non-specific serine/threonine protein kinase/serine/threonine-protein kinase
MNPERWQKVKNILENVLEKSPDSRSDYLVEACGGDEGLRSEIDNLLEFEEVESDLLEQEAVSAVFETSPVPKNLIGREIGNYKITAELGAGGMGAVFLAERADGEFEQKAAVKLIKNGINFETVRRRFLIERQILASLKHPNIAHLIDGGTTRDGLPYFVMEYVEGTPISEYADTNNLTIEQRLDLFRKVCAAVSFAHQKLIIHRDLKPSNILITKDGTAKLLDFGIAKLLKTENGNETRTQAFAFTPEYASPEQICGENLSTATDIYSLGVVLYELLTGTRPFRFEGKNIGEIIETVTKQNPAPPSAISNSKFQISDKTSLKSKIRNPKLRGDLDNIVLKAVKKEPERRYHSVEQFSEDVRRYLKGLPVFARHDTWRYRAEKFVRRNPLLAGVMAIAFLFLIGGISATVFQARKANIERAKAERRFNDVRTLANSFMFEINEEITKSPIKARELLVQRAVEYLDKLASESDGNVELQSELAAAYEKIGEVQAQLFKPGLGKTSDALRSHQKSLEIREKLFAAGSNSVASGLKVVRSRLFVGDILSMSGRLGEARFVYQETVEFCRRLLTLDEKNTVIRQNLANSHARLGQSILRSGSLGEALRNYEEALKIYQTLAAENPGESKFQTLTGFVLSYIGYVKIEMNQSQEAIRYFAEALAIDEKTSDPNNLQTQSNIINSTLWLGVAYSENGDWEKSSFYLQKSLELQKRIYDADKNNFGELNSLADCYLELGRDAVRANKPDAAIVNLTKAIENYKAVWQADTQNFSAQRQISFTQRHLGDALRQKNDLAKAREIYTRSLETIEDLIKQDANNTEWQTDFALLNSRLGEIALSRGDKPKALKYLETAKPVYEKLTAASPENTKLRADSETVKNLSAKLSL